MRSSAWFVVVFLFSCSSTHHIAGSQHDLTIADGKLFTAYFQQRAAEYKALCFQAYNSAATQIALLPPSERKRALITDIDETVLDNSPYAVHQALQGKDYEPVTWFEWTSLGKADTVPGAPQFLKYAASKGIEIFYVTNREEKERSATLSNLQHFQLPNADNAHLILRNGPSSKETRRLEIMKDHDVVMLVGDNLADFSAAYDKKPMSERDAATAQMRAAFGTRWIILPNPGYGDWESAAYGYKQLTPAQKDSAIRSWVKNY